MGPWETKFSKKRKKNGSVGHKILKINEGLFVKIWLVVAKLHPKNNFGPTCLPEISILGPSPLGGVNFQ